MKIKSRITLYIVCVGFFSSLIIASFLLYEALEQPIRILDSMLREDGRRTVSKLEKTGGADIGGPDDLSDTDGWRTRSVWINVFDTGRGETVYASRFEGISPMRPLETGKKAIIRVADPSAPAQAGKEKKIALRAMRFAVEMGDRAYEVQIARPIDKLYEEILEMLAALTLGLVLAIAASFALARVVSDKILRPISDIKELACKISDENLEERIPVGSENDELAGLAETLNGMLDRLHRSFLLQREFLYDTSHELKTPLTTMRLAVESLRQQESCAGIDADEETVSRLESQIWRMDKLVNDLLTLSALEASYDINESVVDLGEIISRLTDDYAFMAEAKGINIAARLPERPVIIAGDREKLRRALSNVLDNAIKYNVENGEVDVNVTEVPDGVTVVVENTGAGLSREETERVFDRLYRVEKSRTFSEAWGTGLGLAIVKKAIELHGGKVFFESEGTGKNRFTIFLPIRKKGNSSKG